MSSVASNHPFPLAIRQNEWFLPIMLAPSLSAVVCFAYSLAMGKHTPCSPALLLLASVFAVVYGARVILREPGPVHRRVCAFCAILFLIYLQLLLPRLWGWPIFA